MCETRPSGSLASRMVCFTHPTGIGSKSGFFPSSLSVFVGRVLARRLLGELLRTRPPFRGRLLHRRRGGQQRRPRLFQGFGRLLELAHQQAKEVESRPLGLEELVEEKAAFG